MFDIRRCSMSEVYHDIPWGNREDLDRYAVQKKRDIGKKELPDALREFCCLYSPVVSSGHSVMLMMCTARASPRMTRKSSVGRILDMPLRTKRIETPNSSSISLAVMPIHLLSKSM